MHSNLCQSYALFVLLFPGIEWKVPRLSYIKHLQSLQICISFTFFLQTHLYWCYILLSDRVQTWGSFLVLSAGKVLSTWDGSNFSFESIKWGAQLELHDQYRLPPCGPVYISLFLSHVLLTLLHIMFAKLLKFVTWVVVSWIGVLHIHTILFPSLLLSTANQTCLEWTLVSNQA
jgi:hypothetical protein